MKNASSRALLPAVACSLLVACNSSPGLGDVYSPAELRELLGDAGGWVLLPFPESKYRPGSVIEVTAEGRIDWIDHLESCGYAEEVLEPERSVIPSVSFTKGVELGASAMIDIHGIQAGPEFGKVSRARLAIQEHGTDAIKRIRLQIWAEDPSNQELVHPQCMEELQKPDRYLVTEAFRISKGTYTLFDETGVALALDAPAVLDSVLKIQPEVRYEVTGEGSLVIEQPVYMAVRRVMRVGSDWQTLAEPRDEDSADARIDRAFREANGL